MSHSILRIQRIKSASDATGIQKHVQRETGKYKNKDIERELSHLNYDFINSTEVDYNEKVKERIENGYAGERKVRSDAIRLVDGIITSDSTFFDNMDHLEREYFFEHTLDFIKEEFGEENVMYANVHLDEKTPHMHFGFVPLTEDGRLSAKEVIGNKKNLSELQNKFNDFINEKGYDMQRGESSLFSEREHLKVEDYKKETEFHKKELDRVKSDLKHEFEVLDNLGSNSPKKNDEKLKKDDLELPEVKKVELGYFKRVKDLEDLEELYKTTDNLVEIAENQHTTLEEKDDIITDSHVAYDKLNRAFKQQKDFEAERIIELNDQWEKDYKKLKAQHEHLTFITEEKINEKAEAVMEAKTLDINSENKDLKHTVSSLQTELSQAKDKNKALVTEKNALKSTISDMEERYQEIKTGFKEHISELKNDFDDIRQELKYEIGSMYKVTKVFIRTLREHDFEKLFNTFRVSHDKNVHKLSKYENPDNLVEELVESDKDEDVMDVELDLDLVRKEMNFENQKDRDRDDGMEM